MRLYYKFSEYLKNKFNCRVHKIPVYAGFTCPNLDGTKSFKGCIYCNNYAFSPSLKYSESLEEQIKKGIEHGKKRFKAEKFIVYFQPYTNTYAPVEILREKFDVVKKFQEVVGISIGTRPDCIDEKKLDLIESYSINYEVWIEYGLQSIHEKTLKLINRNHTYMDFLKSIEMTRKRNIKICAHVIIGLPGENKEEIIETAKECGRLKLDGIKIHPLHVLRNTELEKMYYDGKVKLLNMEEYIEILADFISFLHPETVIQRLTADCKREYLVAPIWLLEKQKMLKHLELKMEKESIYQGKNYKEN
ncbi:MAG: TIGR01212 family radical SAM protein [Candidatus Omnitrophica bacterium]|nr:TIGR01212 family radical SAM protein [Candidatus Omnitrophota bacterium]MCM8806550.1 TIGR01212 family radical SAM protein [Candidatus Omnitrophota bacterium]